MAAAPDAPRLRPLGVGELLDAAIKVCIAHAGTLLRAVLVVTLPVQILSAVVLLSTVDSAAQLGGTTEAGQITTDAAYWAGQGVIGLLSGVSFLLATGACFRAIAEGWLGRRPNWRESLRFATRRALPLLWISLIYGLVIAVILGLGIGPVFLSPAIGAVTIIAALVAVAYLAISWSVAFPVLFVEDERGIGALNRSQGLVRGRWWPSFALIVLGFVLAGIVAFVAGAALGVLSVVTDSLGFLIVVQTVANLLATLISTPFQAAIVALLYFDLRVRKEGFDLEVLAERLGGAPVGDGPVSAVPGYAALDEVPEEVRRQAPYGPPPPGGQPPAAAQGDEPPAEPRPG